MKIRQGLALCFTVGTGVLLACNVVMGERSLPLISVQSSSIATASGLREAIARELARIYGNADFNTSYEVAHVNIVLSGRPLPARIPVMKMCDKTWADTMRETDLGLFNGIIGRVAGGGGGGSGGAGAGSGPRVPTPVWGSARVCVDGSSCVTQWFIVGWEWPSGNQMV